MDPLTITAIGNIAVLGVQLYNKLRANHGPNLPTFEELLAAADANFDAVAAAAQKEIGS